MKKTILAILDGWGHGIKPEVSAITQAKTPFVDSLYKDYPNAELVTFGEQVGLPEGQMGNSEVGHLNIGAGRIVYQDLAKINKAIKDDTLKDEKEILAAIDYAKANDKAFHFMGLLSDGGVHAHISHLKALIDIAISKGLKKIYIHAFLDGRDTSPTSGIHYIKDILDYTENTPAQLASIVGRYYAMDRDNRWERIKLAYDTLVHGKGVLTTDPVAEIQKSYDDGLTDEFIQPIILSDEGKAVATVKEDDVLFFINYRTDRPREISQALSQKDFPEHDMKKLNLYFVTMTRYDEQFKNVKVVFYKDDIKETIGEVVSKAGKTQVRIAETEKYPHVTFFFSGGQEQEFDGERRLLVNSPKVATYDLQPEMSAEGITTSICNDINENQPDFVCLNYANTDMVGHTGDFEACKTAAETVDRCLEQLVKTALAKDYALIVIADHGNSDYMINDDGSPHTAHTLNMVPVFYIDKTPISTKIENGKLADVAPTILKLMQIEQPASMTGKALI